MEAELSKTQFEWLLAEWAGHGDNPGRVFPDLQKSDLESLAYALDEVIYQAQLVKQLV